MSVFALIPCRAAVTRGEINNALAACVGSGRPRASNFGDRAFVVHAGLHKDSGTIMRACNARV